MTPTVKKIAITHPGVNNGLHAGSSCCVNLVYLGLLDSFFKIDSGPPVSDVLAPFIFPFQTLPCSNRKTPRKAIELGGKTAKTWDLSPRSQRTQREEKKEKEKPDAQATSMERDDETSLSSLTPNKPIKAHQN
jgi:hypothetical protein